MCMDVQWRGMRPTRAGAEEVLVSSPGEQSIGYIRDHWIRPLRTALQHVLEERNGRPERPAPSAPVPPNTLHAWRRPAMPLALSRTRRFAKVLQWVEKSLSSLRCCDFGTFLHSAKVVSAPAMYVGTTGQTLPTVGMQWAGAPARDRPARQPSSVACEIRYNCYDL